MPATASIHYSVNGADDYRRPPVLLIHGAGGHHLYWPPQVRRLSGERIFAMDLPGHGNSPGLGRQRVEDYTDDVLTLMSELRLNSAVLIGHSMGGAIALEAAIRHPRRVLGVGLIGTGARLRVDPVILRKASQEESFPEAIRLLAARSFAPDAPARLKELAFARMSEMRPPVLYGDLLACDAFDCMNEVTSIGVPALVLCGELDLLAPPRYSNYLHASIRGSALELIPGAGHMVMLEKPDRVAAAVLRFVEAIDYEPGRQSGRALPP